MWSFEKLFGESFSSGDERIGSMRMRKENVYRKVDKVAGFRSSETSIL